MATGAAAIRWGIVGCGDVTEQKSGPGFQQATGSELRAVMRRDGDKARDFAERHGVPRWHGSVAELLQDDSVDAVYIATPPSSHLEIALQVLAAGKPCYVEKPMARNYAESAEMAAAFAKAGVPLFVAYYRRAYPRYQEVKAILDAGGLGELSSVQYTSRRRPGKGGGWRHDVPTSGGGLFVDVGSHILDIIDFLLGPLRDVQGVASRAPGAAPHDPEDTVSMAFTAGRGAVGGATWNFRAADNFDLLEFTGDRARLLLPDAKNGTECVIEYADGSPARRWQVPAPAPAMQGPLIQSVVDAIRSGDHSRCPSTVEAALRTARYMDTALEGFYAGRDDAFWERPGTWRPNRAAEAGEPRAGPPK